MRRDVFQAIADPTRREILALLSSGPKNLNAVAGEFDITRPAISRHMKILRECGLVEIKKVGRERFCEPRLERLKEVTDWAAQYTRFWESKLQALENCLAGTSGDMETKNSKHHKKPTQ